MAVHNNPYIPDMTNPLREITLPELSVGELLNLSETCKAFNAVVKFDPASSKKITDGKRLTMADKVIVYVNRGFLNGNDFNKRNPGVSYQFSLGTLLRVAAWLREKGNAVIPPHKANTFQPRALMPTDYVNGMSGPDATGIYYQLWKLHNAGLGADPQYGEKAFHNDSGFHSTPTEKAEAIEKFVSSELEKE